MEYLEKLPFEKLYRARVMLSAIRHLAKNVQGAQTITLQARVEDHTNRENSVLNKMKSTVEITEIESYLDSDTRKEELEALQYLIKFTAITKREIIFNIDEHGVNQGPQEYIITFKKDYIDATITYVEVLLKRTVRGSAVLKMDDFQVPIVKFTSEMREESVRLPTMRSGHAYNIATHCLNNHAGEQVELNTLKQVLGINGVTNITEALRKSVFDGKSGALQHFVESTPNAVTFYKRREMKYSDFNDMIRYNAK